MDKRGTLVEANTLNRAFRLTADLAKPATEAARVELREDLAGDPATDDEEEAEGDQHKERLEVTLVGGDASGRGTGRERRDGPISEEETDERERRSDPDDDQTDIQPRRESDWGRRDRWERAVGRRRVVGRRGVRCGLWGSGNARNFGSLPLGKGVHGPAKQEGRLPARRVLEIPWARSHPSPSRSAPKGRPGLSQANFPVGEGPTYDDSACALDDLPSSLGMDRSA